MAPTCTPAISIMTPTTCLCNTCASDAASEAPPAAPPPPAESVTFPCRASPAAAESDSMEPRIEFCVSAPRAMPPPAEWAMMSPAILAAALRISGLVSLGACTSAASVCEVRERDSGVGCESWNPRRALSSIRPRCSFTAARPSSPSAEPPSAELRRESVASTSCRATSVFPSESSAAMSSFFSPTYAAAAAASASSFHRTVMFRATQSVLSAPRASRAFTRTVTALPCSGNPAGRIARV
mmetsp:Transcript_57810/g.183293  ORF Transcript_57810/g.183293 Transcript_57810/m.183293 type:complete len:240 (-) Transcript_57810:2596-3315(-)